MRTLPLLAASLFLLGACASAGGDDDDAKNVPPDVSASSDAADLGTPPADAPTAESSAPETLAGLDLSGTWAQLDVRSALATVPLAGQVTRSTTSLFRAELVQAGAEVAVTLQLCALSSDSGTDLVQTVFPDALVASIGPQSFTAGLAEQGGGVRYLEPRHVDVRGCHLVDEENDALPVTPDDPRVYDQDGDGRPGLTVRIVGVVNGEVYVVQRLATRATGAVLSADRLEGLVEWSDEQQHLGTDNQLLKDPTPSSPDPQVEHSYFRMVRLPAGDDCAAIVARRDQLFP